MGSAVNMPRPPRNRTIEALGVLRVPNFRRYVTAQLASGAGMWNQRVAELWLLLELTGDGLSLGLGTALRTAPAIFLAAPAGWLADRYDRRRLLTSTQGARGAVALVMAAVVWSTTPSVGVIYGLILLLGMANALDGPMRRSYVRDVVGPDDLHAAAGLHTATISVGRIFGPLIAGVVIAVAGIAWAFAVSGLTAAAAIWAVRSIRPVAEARPDPPADRARHDGGDPAPSHRPTGTALRFSDVLVLLGTFSMLGWNVDVVLPILAQSVLGRGSVAFSGLVICLSVGTLVGSVVAAGLPDSGRTLSSLIVPMFAFCVALPLVAATDLLLPIAATLVVVGICGGLFLSASNAGLQLVADPVRQGRSVAIYSIVFTGSRAIGAPVIGVAVDQLGARTAIVAVGAVTALAGTLTATILWRRSVRRYAGVAPATDGAS